jgi:hypothetical protein
VVLPNGGDVSDIPLRPPGVKFYGYHLAIRKHPSDPNNTTTWMEMYVNWDFAGYMKPQIDWVQAIGANCLMLVGDVEWVTGSAMTLSQYVAKRREIVEYLLERGMYMLPYGASHNRNWGTTNTAQAAVVMAADAAMLSKYPNVIGYALDDEAWIARDVHGDSIATVAAQEATLYNAVKAVVPSTFAVAVSCPAGAYVSNLMYGTTGEPGNKLAAVINYCDYLHFHPFWTPTTPAEWSTIHGLYPNKDIILASTGPDQLQTSGQRTAMVTEDLVLFNHAQSRGGAMWCIRDFTTNSGAGGWWGHFSDLGVARTPVTAPFTAGVTAPYPRRMIRPYRGRPSLNARIRMGYT